MYIGACVGSNTFTTCTGRPEDNLRCCSSVFSTFCVSQDVLLAGTLPCKAGDLLDKLPRICLFLPPIHYNLGLQAHDMFSFKHGLWGFEL